MASAHMEAVSKGTPEHGTSGVKDIEDVTSRLHDVAFEVLSSNRADGDSVNAIRSTLTSYLEFSEHHTGREVVSDRSSWDHKQKKEELRHILSQRAPIDVFFEISRLLDGMRRREYVAAQLRAKILKRHKFLSETTSDQLYHLDIKEMDLKRRVEERDFGVSSARIDSQEDLLIKKVAVSMDPVTNLVLQIALGEGGSDRVVVLSSLQESLKLATAVPKQKDVSEAVRATHPDRSSKGAGDSLREPPGGVPGQDEAERALSSLRAALCKAEETVRIPQPPSKIRIGIVKLNCDSTVTHQVNSLHQKQVSSCPAGISVSSSAIVGKL
mmetsp:Transcript_10777/g.36214  ORF Transcript_10777/g.36214 Transcript_10777/m.36214 type:complete len:326 (-) Transcript_10777:737-1714(-)